MFPPRPRLIALYWIERLNIADIAALYDVSDAVMGKHMKRVGIVMRRAYTPAGTEAMMMWPSTWEWEREKLVRLKGEL